MIVHDDPRAHWHGPPSRERIQTILSLTRTDDRGRRYWRETPNSPWLRLWDRDAVPVETPWGRLWTWPFLNAAIDRWGGVGT